jgi:hypothetical protein
VTFAGTHLFLNLLVPGKDFVRVISFLFLEMLAESVTFSEDGFWPPALKNLDPFYFGVFEMCSLVGPRDGPGSS